MYTSAEKTWGTLSAVFLGVTIFTALFGAVYELFGHGVFSYFMLYAFAFPLILGVVPYVCCLIRKVTRFHRPAIRFWNAGIITLTVGSLFQGVLEIYGTTNRLAVVYQIVGILLLLGGIFLPIMFRRDMEEVE